MAKDVLGYVQAMLSTPEGKTASSFALVLLVLYYCYYKIQQMMQMAENRRNQGSQGQGSIQSRMKALNPLQRYVLGFSETRAKILISSEAIMDSKEDRKEPIIKSRDLDTLQKMCRCSDVYIVTTETEDSGPSDAEIQKWFNAEFKSKGLLEAGFQTHRIIVTSTAVGRAHVARQIAPSLYVDNQYLPLSMVQKHIKDPVLISSSQPNNQLGKISYASSLYDYFLQFDEEKKKTQDESPETSEKKKLDEALPDGLRKRIVAPQVGNGTAVK
mmetsp:Transcript_16146/g.24358  ORF Transcript_16146/g.24358 Transcript_16146/m.24358 type:complete len:271 (-) Transcript_16146:54-866(-)